MKKFIVEEKFIGSKLYEVKAESLEEALSEFDSEWDKDIFLIQDNTELVVSIKGDE